METAQQSTRQEGDQHRDQYFQQQQEAEQQIEEDTNSSDQASLVHRLPLNEENRRVLPTMLSFLLLITILFPKLTYGNDAKYEKFCSLSQYQTVYLQRSEDGELVMSSNSTPAGIKIAVNSSSVLNDLENDLINADSNSSLTEYIPVKRCGCLTNAEAFCLFREGIDKCGVPKDESTPVGCFYSDSKSVFITNAWPVVLLWYTALIMFLLATENGRNARNFLVSLCNKDRNRALADQIVAREIQVRDQMRVAAIAQQRHLMQLARVRREGENANLILKTKRYCSPRKRSMIPCELEGNEMENRINVIRTPEKMLNESSSEMINSESPHKTPETEVNSSFHSEDSSSSFVYHENEEDVTCTICIGPIRDGDRIGALPCNHLFHSSCLKQWIRRRNVCPLCQEPNIATPQRYTAPITDTEFLHQQIQQHTHNNYETLTSIPLHRRIRTELSSLDTNADLLPDSPIPPPPPRGSRTITSTDRLQRLTLTEDGDVQITSANTAHTRAVVTVPSSSFPNGRRNRSLTLAAGTQMHRQRIRIGNRNRNRRFTIVNTRMTNRPTQNNGQV